MVEYLRRIHKAIVSIRIFYYVHALGAIYVCGIVIAIHNWN